MNGSERGEKDRLSVQLDAGLELFTATMRGGRIKPGQLGRAGPAAGLFVDADGRWRPDGLARAHSFYSELLERFTETGTRRVGSPNALVRDLLGRVTGLTASPMSVNGALTATGEAVGGPSAGTISNWRRALPRNPEVHEVARVRLPSLDGELPPMPRGELPLWESDPRHWPAAQDWVRIRGVLLAHPIVPLDLRQAMEHNEPELLVTVVRDRAGAAAEAYLAAAVTPHPEPDLGGYTLAPEHAWRWFRQKALCQWQAEVEFLPPRSIELPVADIAQGRFVNQYRRRAAAAAQLHFGRVVSHRKHIAEVLRLLTLEDESIRRQLRANGRLERLFLYSGRSLESASPTVTRARSMDMVREDAASDQEELVASFTSYAKNIRASLREQQERGNALALATVYSDQRGKLDLTQLTDPRLLLELDLADHSVDWDLVPLSTTRGARGLRDAFLKATSNRSDAPMSANPGLRVHRFRSRMVEETKAGRWGSSVQFGRLAWTEANSLINEGLLHGDYAVECLQQIALGLAGVWVKQAERCLLAQDRDHCSIPPEVYVRSALLWSERANAMLGKLVGHGLPAVRGVDGRIGSVAWTAHTPTLLLRAQLAALTAVQSGFCRSTDVIVDTSMRPVSVDQAEHLYLAAVSNKYAQPGVILQLAFWTSLMHSGRTVPVAPPGEVATTIERLDILHCPPDEVQQRVHLDWAEITIRLRERNYNANILGRLRPGSLVHTYFADIHTGFASWVASWQASARNDRSPTSPSLTG